MSDQDNQVPDLLELLGLARDLADRLAPGGAETARSVGARLADSVVRPLAAVLPADGATTGRPRPDVVPEGRSPLPLADEVWELARAATALRAAHPDMPELAEATAALHDLTAVLADEDTARQRLAELAAAQAGLVPHIQAAPDGPYLATNPAQLIDWLGQPLPVRPQMALCRCGKSGLKPLCDGTHATTGFSGAKDPGRVPDRRDTYHGQQVTIFDNRGTCQHAGFCTDRLPIAFRKDREPFVAPSGGRMDEIIRAARDCPSGALSYAIDDREARDEVDWHATREPTIQVTRDGPYRVTGGIPLTGPDGQQEPRNEGASREHYALCRCGQSQNKPFCSGMHWYVEFRDPVQDADREPTVFEWSGGLPALTRMTRIFYEKLVPEDPLLAPLFATMSPDHPERVAKWLAEVFCGPRGYSGEYGGYSRMLSQHLGKHLGEEQRARWVSLILQAAREANLPNDAEFRSVLGAYFEWGSHLAVENSQTGATPPGQMPMPHWDWGTAAGPPGSRVSALGATATEERPAVLPGPGETCRFDAHVKTMFRQVDRRSMLFAFDLWSYEDVTAHADAILARLRAGTMPCDGAWPQERVDAFASWTENGKPQ